MYKHDYNKDEDLKTVQSIKERRSSVMNTMEIEKFMKKYKDENKREPSIEEIYDNLEDQVNKIHIDRFVQRLNTRIDNDLSKNKNK